VWARKKPPLPIDNWIDDTPAQISFATKTGVIWL
jgi:hypothetical protein